MYQYPYGDSQQLNLDWIINKLIELKQSFAGKSAELEEFANALISLTYSPTKAYNNSDIVFHDGHLYRCNTTIPAPGEVWNPAHWDQIMLGNTVANLVRAVAGMNSDHVFNESNVPGTHVTEALNALVEDIRYDNHKVQQKKNGAYTDVIPVEDTPSNNSDRLASSKAAYDLQGAIKLNNLPVNPCIKEQRLIAHQGGLSYVQSTNKCFQAAINQGFKILEGDVRKTSDNKFVIWHDSTIGGLTIASSTLAQVTAVTLDYDCHALSLEDFLKLAINNSCAVELDFSTAHFSDANFTTYAQSIYDTIKAINPALDSVIWTLNYQKVVTMQSIDPSIILCYSGMVASTISNATVQAAAKASRYFMASQNKSNMIAEVVQWLHTNGYYCKVYTIETEAELFTAFASGADCAIVQAILPQTTKQDYIAGMSIMNNWIYDGRVELSDSTNANSFRIINGNIAYLALHCVSKKDLTSSQRSIMQLPSVFCPYSGMGTYLANGVMGATAVDADATYIASISASGYINVTHGGGLVTGKHFTVGLWYQIRPFTETFPALS